MKKGDKVIITKLSDDVFNGNHPNMINEGYQKIGVIDELPEIGKRFLLKGLHLGSYLHTSVITEIIDENTFKTENSTYKLDLYNDSSLRDTLSEIL